MRKDKVWKQVLALVLSAALVVGNGSSVSAATGDPAADNGTSTTAAGTAGENPEITTPTDAVEELRFDFNDVTEGVTGDDGKTKTYTQNGVTFVDRNGVKIADAPGTDAEKTKYGKALKFTTEKEMMIDGNPVKTGDSCLTSEGKALSKMNLSNGFKFSLDFYPEAQRDWNYVFMLGHVALEGNPGSGRFLTGTTGFIAAYGDPWTANFPVGNFVEGSVANTWDYFCQEANAHKWYHLDYIYSSDGISIVVDDVPTVAWKANKAVMQKVLNGVNNGEIRIGMGPDLKNEGFLGYIDNVVISTRKTCKHEMDGEPIREGEATCTEPAYKLGKCKNCGEIVAFEDGEPNGHTYSNKVEAKQGNCTENGCKEHYTCTVCNGYFIVSGDDGAKVEVAAEDVITVAPGHDYGENDEYIVTTKATPEEDGKKVSTCQRETCDNKVIEEKISKASNITLKDGDTYDYTGEEIKPKVVVKDADNKTIASSHYEVTYSNNKAVGQAKAIVTFKETSEKYTGSKELPFTIKGKDDNQGGGNQGGGNNQGGNNQGGNQNQPKADLTLDKSAVTLYTGKASKTVTVKATVTGASKTVTWKSSNDKIAKVDNTGKITAVKAGKATVTATANGISKSINVTVKNPTITIKNGKKAVKKNTVTVKKKKSVKLTVSVNPKNSGITIGKLSKKQKKIATVTFKKGKLTIKGKKKGTVKVKITSGKATKTLTVKVK